MVDKQILSRKLIEVLATVDFATRYYSFCDSQRAKVGETALTFKDFEAALRTMPLSVRYNSKEKFFLHEQADGPLHFSLRVAFTVSSIEMMLYLGIERAIVGGPFSVLAKQVAQLHNPNFNHSPAYPKLPFSDAEKLVDALQFGVSLFQDVKRAILSMDWNP